MTLERWQEIETLFHAALERMPSERPAFLAEACAGDSELRREVESLLATKERGGNLLDAGASDLAAEWVQKQQPQKPLSEVIGHFRIVSLLGKGGMGEVWLAEDLRLRRKVALKLLPPEFTSNEGRLRRFEREAHAASALNHPSVAHIYEIGEAEGVSFIAMEYVEGQTLAAKIADRPLEIVEIIEIGLQAADALDEAHGKGIMHRDLKPGNIMVTPRGQVKVLDFGLAKINRPGAQEVDSNLITMTQTTPGVVMGTLPYMSPEQALGRDVDYRSDIFSLGAVLYEAATSQRPFCGMNASETLDLILHAEPEAISHFNPDAPVQLERIVGKCLEKDRVQRYQSARDLLVDLQNLKRAFEDGAPTMDFESREKPRTLLTSRRLLAISALVMLAVATLGYQVLFRGAPAAVFPEIKSLAVLPLKNLGDPTQEYFADGMTEAIINSLTQIHALDVVISRTSMMRYKESHKSLPEIAAELNVDAVIEGSVQKSGGRVRVIARLVPAATDSPLWLREYNRDESDVLKLQSEVARAVADEIRIQVTPEERARLAAARNINPQAHDAYLHGRHHLRTNEEDLRQAIRHFDRAIQLEPDYAAAYVGLSNAWRMRGRFGAKDIEEVMPLAIDAAVKAVTLDPRLAEAHVALSAVKGKDWVGAENDLTRALELDPNSAVAHEEYADLLMALGRHDEAIRKIRRAEQLDPLSSEIQSRYTRVLYRARKYADALPHLQLAIELDPNPGNSMPYWIGAELYAEMGRYDDALANLKKFKLHGGGDLSSSAGVARTYALMGKRNEARRMLAELKATTDPARFADIPVARAYAALGDKNEAFEVLFRMVDERERYATYIKVDPPLFSLHSDPRWKVLLRSMNYPPE